MNLIERNFKHFNEREFTETINSTNWDEILQLNRNDPNLSIENLYSQINFCLDEFQDIQFLMWEREKIFHKYCKVWNEDIILIINTRS